MSDHTSDHARPDTRPHDARRPDRRRFLGTGMAVAGGGLLGAALDFGAPGAASAEPLLDGAGGPGQVDGSRVRRTPDARFADLPDFPFAPYYVPVAGGPLVGRHVRMHYVDERPRRGRGSGETVLLLHGEPSWSYLWRHVVPPLVAAGHRVVAPDLVGFGRSDKPVDRFAYTANQHVDWLREALFDRLGLHDVTLVCHDWGGQLGLRLVAEHPERFRRVVATNTGFDVGDEDNTEAWPALAQWFHYTQRANPFRPSDVVDQFTATALSPEVRAAYDAPYLDNSYLEGVRRFPLLIPIDADDDAYEANTRAWAVLRTLRTPFLCAFSDGDHVTHGDHSRLSGHIAGAQGQPHVVITGAEHFLQEDRPAELAAVVDGFIRMTT